MLHKFATNTDHMVMKMTQTDLGSMWLPQEPEQFWLNPALAAEKSHTRTILLHHSPVKMGIQDETKACHR